MADRKSDDSVVAEARELFGESQDGSDFNRNAMHDDFDFARLGNQWPDEIQKIRKEEGRPCLTINKLPSFIRQVVNDARQNKPAIEVSPVDNGADVETAEVLSGLIRSIERGSSASTAYDTAIDHSVSGGFGFFKIAVEYVHPESFEMECQIKRIANPHMVHWDVNSVEFDASDWNYAFVSEFYTEDEFESEWPKAEKVSFEGDDRDNVSYWLEDDKIRVAEFWRVEEKPATLLLIKNTVSGEQMSVLEEKMSEPMKMMIEAGIMEVARERPTTNRVIKRRMMSGVEVLEEDDWSGSMIPICPVWGEEVVHDGRRHFRSMTRDARDPQLMFNYWRSASTELVALAPKTPWVGEEGFVPEGHEEKWASANTRSHAFLEYAKGKAAPRRQEFAGVPAGALQEALNASDDIKSIIGIYDAGLGARSNETSGRAILARQREGDVSNFHFVDNLSRAITYCGKVLVELIPHVYSGRETLRILGQDEAEKLVTLMKTGDQNAPAEEGEEKLFDLNVGRYDVSVKAGPSYATQREETKETLIEIMRAVPDSAILLGDILLNHMDFPEASKVADRLKLMLPQQVQAAEGIAPPAGGPVPPGAPSLAPGAPAPQPMQSPQNAPAGPVAVPQGPVQPGARRAI